MSDIEIPRDEVVIAKLHELGSTDAGTLVAALEADDYDRRDAQRAIQRCLDRGSIYLGNDLELVVAEDEFAHAA